MGMQSMAHRDELETVLRVACLTEDRAGDEQRALLGLALRLDEDFGSFASTKRRKGSRPPRLVGLVENTYDPSEGRRATLTKAQRATYERLGAKWRPCPRCRVAMGAHYVDNRCP